MLTMHHLHAWGHVQFFFGEDAADAVRRLACDWDRGMSLLPAGWR